jgi:hypothetical protein
MAQKEKDELNEALFTAGILLFAAFLVFALKPGGLVWFFFGVDSSSTAKPTGVSCFRRKTFYNVYRTFRLFLLTFFRFVWFRHRKALLLSTVVFTFLFFHPDRILANLFDERTLCPDGYAYQLGNGHYIRCEDFDEFHEGLSRGIFRKELYLK